MIKGKTNSGFEFEYDRRRLDDMRFVDAMAEALDPEAEEFTRLSNSSKLIGMLLGKELKAKLYEHIGAKHDGRVPSVDLVNELGEIMAAAGKSAEKN